MAGMLHLGHMGRNMILLDWYTKFNGAIKTEAQPDTKDAVTASFVT